MPQELLDLLLWGSPARVSPDQEAALELLLEGVSANLQKLYKAGWKKYSTFCQASTRPLHLMLNVGTEWWSVSDKSYMAALQRVQLKLEPCNPCPSFIFPHTKIPPCGIKKVHSLNNPTTTARLPNCSIPEASH